MTTLPAPATAAAILSFDFNGTLHHPAENPPVPAAFFQIIRQLREEQGAVWGINTGRSMQKKMSSINRGANQTLK